MQRYDVLYYDRRTGQRLADMDSAVTIAYLEKLPGKLKSWEVAKAIPIGVSGVPTRWITRSGIGELSPLDLPC